MNNGTCYNLAGSFGCYCQPGFTGVYCQSKVDYCASSPCVYSQTVTCVNDYTLNNYKCVCQPGNNKDSIFVFNKKITYLNNFRL